MKNVISMALAAVAVAGVAASVSSPALAKSKPCKTLSIIDPDNDGEMTLDEAKKRAGIIFDKLNKDAPKDATLDVKELKGRLTKKELVKADPDKDGTIDKAEYLAVVEARFKAANHDKDTTIECKELSTKAGQALLKLLK